MNIAMKSSRPVAVAQTGVGRSTVPDYLGAQLHATITCIVKVLRVCLHSAPTLLMFALR